MPHYRFDSAASALFTLARDVQEFGVQTAPRGQKTYEMRAATIEISDPRDCLTAGIGRKLNTKLAALEALQLIGGFSDPVLMASAAPLTAKYLDGGQFAGAYGPRIISQMDAVVQRLADDPDTRQAVVQIWDPSRDLFHQHKDLPCTVYFTFYVRDQQLQMHTHMRSNDLWLGFPYDIVQFTQLQCTLAKYLEIQVGAYTHYADSLHLYERDLPSVNQLTAPSFLATGSRMLLDGIDFRQEYSTWSESVAQTARDITYLYEGNPVFDHPSPAEAWLIKQMRNIDR